MVGLALLRRWSHGRTRRRAEEVGDARADAVCLSTKREQVSKKMSIRASLNELMTAPFLLGVLVLLANVGSRFIVLELSRSQEEFLQGEVMRKLVIFAAAFVATRDVLTSLLLVGAFTAIVSGLFHEESRFCVLPDVSKCRPSAAEVARARAVLEKAGEQAE